GARPVPRCRARHRGARGERRGGGRRACRGGGGAARRVPARPRPGHRAKVERVRCPRRRMERGRAPLRAGQGEGERLRLPGRARPRGREGAARRRFPADRAGRPGLAPAAARGARPRARHVKAALLGTLVAGGLAALDGTPVAQTLASQPLVTATVLGVIWGDWSTALAVGTVLQILAASTLPIGARTPEDYSVGGVVGAGVALSIASGAPFEHVRQAASLAGVMAGMAAATLGVPLLRWQRQHNEGLARWCEDALRAGREGALAEAQGAAVALAFAIGLAVTALWLWFAHLGSA